MPYFQLLAVIMLAWAGVMLAGQLGRTRWWPAGFLAAAAVTALVFLGHRIVSLSFVPPISWTVDAAINPPLMALVIPMLLVTLMVRLPARRTRIAVAVLAIVVLAYDSVLPIALPLAARASLAAGATRMDAHQVCLQTHAYTCGPASAVTCLRALGASADEGPLAIDSRCGPLVGADGFLLAAAIQSEFPAIHASYQHFARLDALPVPAVASMNLPKIGGHYVAVLAILPDSVRVGDPLSGEYAMPRPEFEAAWQHAAVVFTK